VVGLILGNLLPTLLTWSVITLIFLLMPNRRTHRWDAVIGGGVAAVLLAGLRYTFAFYIQMATAYQAIYGALAAVPVFLMWLYLIWLFVMAGAVVTAGLADWRSARTGYMGTAVGRVILALEVLARMAGVREGNRGWSRVRLVKTVNAPDALMTAVLECLRKGQFVAHTDTGEWVLSRDLERTTLAELVSLFGLGFGSDIEACAMQANEIGRRVCTHLRGAAESERSLLSVSLARLAMLPADPAPAP
jgi:membrane protein